MPTSVRHPILADEPIQGRDTVHRISFAQRNGHLTVMEPVDLTVTRDRTRLRERAGFAAYMFSDVVEAEPTTERIAIIRATKDDETDDNGAYALKLLENNASRVINWLSDVDRKEFIRERVEVAQSIDGN